MSEVTIALDVMSGDHGVVVTVPAAVKVLKYHPHLNLLLVGDQVVVRQALQDCGVSESDRLRIHHASEVVEMSDTVSYALRKKKGSSMRVTVNLVKQEVAQACVSAGNTGALMATARFVLKTLPGVDRPAIITAFPTRDGGVTYMLDLGANVDSNAEHLYQFAVMGSAMVAAVNQLDNKPRIALLNIGEEDIKGNEQVKAAAALLAGSPAINYVGYAEGNDIFTGIADVIVCDGFVGNIALKACEGAAKLIAHHLKAAFMQNAYTKFIGLFTKPILRTLAKTTDTGRYNGASLLGLQGIVIKSHGHAGIDAFANAIEEAVREVESNIPQRIKDEVALLLNEGGNG